MSLAFHPMHHTDFEPVYFAGETPPAPGCIHEVAAGLYWLRMPMPLALDHINLWLLDDGPGWTIVDCGLATDATRTAWEQVFASVLGGKPVTRVICTHMHPDHLGLADWLCQRWDAPLCMTQGEYLSARVLSAGLPPTDTASMLAHYRRHGADPVHVQELGGRGNFYARMVPTVPSHYQRLVHGQVLRIGADAWQVVEGGGHSPEHAALWCEARGVLIAGDLLLPRISTNVSVFPIEPEADVLGRYLRALARFALLPAGMRVLPSHGLPFTGAHARIRQLREHHAERLLRVLHACDGRACSAAELVPVLCRRTLDAHQLGFALGEAIAHAHRLWSEGALQRQIDAQGVIRFGLPGGGAGLDAAVAQATAARAAGL